MDISEKEIRIVSGEGEIGTVELFIGKHSQRAIKSRLTKERCNGDRWARAIQFLYPTTFVGSDIGVDLETGHHCAFPALD